MAGPPHWLSALHRPDAYPHPVAKIDLIETHLSWVFLTGEWAYKLKKPIQLPFVDFSTLEKRLEACHEELRLNRRTAPGIYEEVCDLVETPEGPRFLVDGEILEYAVRMRQFPQSDVLLAVAERGGLTGGHVEHLARSIANMHQSAKRSPPESTFGSPAVVRQYTEGCFPPISACDLGSDDRRRLATLATWTEQEAGRLDVHFEQRRQSGFVRECHGDLHLGNLVLVDGIPRPFDCLEFNAELRFIDVISDLAFVVMDLIERGVPGLAWLLVNGWLEQTGDFAGLAALRYYEVYRALVRAKVAAIRLSQPALTKADVDAGRLRLTGYLELAGRLSSGVDCRLILMHGLSGSGKSYVARELAQRLGAVCLRSDVERKRPAGSEVQGTRDLYAESSIAEVYDRMLQTTRGLLMEGHCVVVDATFLKKKNREPYEQLARELRVPWVIVTCEAPDAVLEERILQRGSAGRDPSDATLQVLRSQQAAAEPLSTQEREAAVRCETSGGLPWDELADAVRGRASEVFQR